MISNKTLINDSILNVFNSPHPFSNNKQTSVNRRQLKIKRNKSLIRRVPGLVPRGKTRQGCQVENLLIYNSQQMHSLSIYTVTLH